uniref:Uncharacterized protein n=1 Tax=Populus alba TaxID=43335 RepID=A0A4U5QW10_POPAL|nr:hypothetical protein D5086_0000055480 [Populus alba]
MKVCKLVELWEQGRKLNTENGDRLEFTCRVGSFYVRGIVSAAETGKSRVDTKQQPPGPPAWPVFGNIFDLGAIPHQTLYKLKEKYGPVIWLKLGYTNTLVIQSAETAAGLFKNHDLAFSDRKVLVFTAHNYYQGSQALGWYVDEDVAEAQAQGESVEIKVAHYLFLMTFNLIGNLVLSRDLLNPRSKDGHEFYDAMNNDMGQTMRIVEKFVKERTGEWKPGRKKSNDFLDALLERVGGEKDGPDVISDQNRLIIILVNTRP